MTHFQQTTLRYLGRREEHGHHAPGRDDVDENQLREGELPPLSGPDIHRHLSRDAQYEQAAQCHCALMGTYML